MTVGGATSPAGGGPTVFFCPICFGEIGEGATVCPHCRADLAQADALPFAEKLCRALWHPDAQTAVRAAWILGERRERLAVDELIRLLEATQDSYLAEAAVEALGKIGDPRALPALEQAAKQGSVRVRRAARTAREKILSGAGCASTTSCGKPEE